jgi:L-ascorbate metabolism protein UlaG (beta-lactamase superfamily)
MQRSIARIALAIVCSAVFAAVSLAADGKVRVQWLGQATTKITTPGGKVIVIDPFLVKNPKTPEKYKDLKALGKVDLILVTHAHWDHFADAPDLAKLNEAPLFAPAGLNSTLLNLEVLPEKLIPRMNKSGTASPLGAGITITPVHAEHSSELDWTDPITGKKRTFPGGEPIGWVVKLENGFTVYHMGDTGMFGDMKLVAEYYKPDLIMMPIGGHFVMSPVDAAYVTKNFLRAKNVIPIHYGTFPVLRGTPKEYMDALGSTTTKVHAINPGDEVAF